MITEKIEEINCEIEYHDFKYYNESANLHFYATRIFKAIAILAEEIDKIKKEEE